MQWRTPLPTLSICKMFIFYEVCIFMLCSLLKENTCGFIQIHLMLFNYNSGWFIKENAKLMNL